MYVGEKCVRCLYDKQARRMEGCKDERKEGYLAEVRQALEERDETMSAPYMEYVFRGIYEKYFGEEASYAVVKQEYNDLMLSMEQEIEEKIEGAGDPLAASLFYARTGNYIDFGVMSHVDKDQFLALLDEAGAREEDREVYRAFLDECARAKNFLLLADNCGEIVLDKLFLRQLKKRFPALHLTVMVRGREALNDVTAEDAVYVGLDREADIVPNGNGVAGTVYGMLSPEAKETLDRADVILSKGQGNYECISGQGRHIFYSFLCKCEVFTERFQVAPFTGMLVEETGKTQAVR